MQFQELEGTEFFKHFKVNFAISSFEILSFDLLPAMIILGLRMIPLNPHYVKLVHQSIS